ncbi:MAG: hypothetical protein EGQ35_04790 [Clostridiales bacterium]|nr:hypothetical protein [Clostridiales bacterium]
MKLKKDNELLFIIGNAAFWMAIGAGLIYSGDNGGIVYICFGMLILLLELIAEKLYADRLERELNAEQRQQRTIIVQVAKDE